MFITFVLAAVLQCLNVPRLPCSGLWWFDPFVSSHSISNYRMQEQVKRQYQKYLPNYYCHDIDCFRQMRPEECERQMRPEECERMVTAKYK